jgi:DNA polymerase III gamma/tau subunit
MNILTRRKKMTNKEFREMYRPKCFAEVVGNERTVKFLKNIALAFHALKNIPKGLFFHGLHGTGKTTLALLLIKALVCQNFPKYHDVCGICKNCLSFNNLTGPDEYSFHDCSKITAKYIDEVLEGLKHLPLTKTKLHIHIFDEFHRAKEPIQDKFLVPLERMQDILLIFCAIDLKKINNEAFIQRNTVLMTRAPEIEQLVPWFQRICKNEGIKVKEISALRQVAKGADRLPRGCLSILEKVYFLGEPLSVDLVKEIAEDMKEPSFQESQYFPMD